MRSCTRTDFSLACAAAPGLSCCSALDSNDDNAQPGRLVSNPR
jgi:hypothetical protein